MRKSEELSEQEDEEEEALEGEEGQENVVGEEDEAGGGGCAEWERRSERTAGDPSASAILEEESYRETESTSHMTHLRGFKVPLPVHPPTQISEDEVT